jgi:CD109 antigen
LVKAVIYNYLDEDVTVTATLYENEMFENLLVDGERNVRVVQIPKDEAVQVGWPIRATKIGALPIKVRAVANGNIAGDELQRVLRVKPAGQAVSQVFNGLLQNTETATLDIAFPANVVPGSQRLEIRLFGNIMANTMANIDELLKMPYGCGEQNMVNFAPAVFIYRYLAQSQKLTDEIRDKATKIIETGYQRQLKYRHNGGGFSAFGESSYNDRGPSTLLSSFVLKCFRAANALLPKKAIDDQIIEDEMMFLVSKFENGNFVESGKVFSSTLMGALDKNGPVAGTAYALIALLESGVEGDVYRNVANEALATLAGAVGDIEDIHTLALVTYSLTLGGHEKKAEAMEKLLGMGEQNAGSIEWLVENKYYYGSGERMSASVEVASYVLLSYAQDLPATMDDALPVFRGITRHLSESGGFKSTQDTVIGVQAMAKFAEFLVEEEMNVVVSAELDGQNVFSSQPIRNDNSDLVVIQNLNLTDDFTLGSLSLSSLGVGSVFSQVVQHYNVRDAAQDPFKLTFERVVSVVKRDTDSEPSPNNICIKINTAATEDPEFRVPDGMSLLMVDHPSGFEYTSHSNEPDSEPQRVEQGSEKTTFYFDDLASEKEITICMTKTQSVANPKPIFINVQDYYNPDARSNLEVSLDDQQSTELCDLCGEFCADLCGVAPSSAPAIPGISKMLLPFVAYHTLWCLRPLLS